MPASSIDTFLACSIMIVLVLSAIVSTSNTLRPSIDELLHGNDAERFQQLAQHLLLSEGAPANWGSRYDVIPDSLGLADSASSQPYQLDIDKVSRLNNQNIYSLSYSQLWQSFGISDASFRIEIKTLFNLSTTLISTTNGVNDTTYQFEIYAEKSGAPVLAYLHSYVVVRDYVNNFASSTSSNGHSSILVTIPNSLNGTALLLTFAKAESNPQIVAYDVYTFSHNSSEPSPNRTFAELNPLNYVLNVTFTYPNEEVLKTLVFTYNYNFSLIEKNRNAQSAEYNIPRLLDASPMLLVITGLNQSTSFAEWSPYPQVPLETGADFDESTSGVKTVSFSHIVTINGALYEIVTKWGESGSP
jgi:hypothetical protein